MEIEEEKKEEESGGSFVEDICKCKPWIDELKDEHSGAKKLVSQYTQ